MRNFILAACAVAVAVPAGVASFPTQAEAKKRYYKPRVYTRNGKTYCRHSDGTTGLIVGGVGGALIGNSIDHGGALGTVLGGVGGALGGRAIDRTLTADKRCR